jgi:regulator of replication initiation timing
MAVINFIMLIIFSFINQLIEENNKRLILENDNLTQSLTAQKEPLIHDVKIIN